MASAATVAVVTLIATVAAAGISAYSANEQAKSQEQIANYNYAVQQQNANIRQKVAERQAVIQHQLVEQSIAKQKSDAAMVRSQAQAKWSQAQEDIRRQREEKERFLARQRSAYASSGVLLEGTPLAVLAETAGKFELAIQDRLYMANIENQGLGYQETLIKQGADVEQYRSHLIDLDTYAAQAEGRLASHQAEIDLLAGMSKSSGYKMESYGTLISGVGTASYQGYNFGRQGAFSGTK